MEWWRGGGVAGGGAGAAGGLEGGGVEGWRGGGVEGWRVEGVGAGMGVRFISVRNSQTGSVRNVERFGTVLL